MTEMDNRESKLVYVKTLEEQLDDLKKLREALVKEAKPKDLTSHGALTIIQALEIVLREERAVAAML